MTPNPDESEGDGERTDPIPEKDSVVVPDL